MIAVPAYLEESFLHVAEVEHQPVSKLIEKALIEFLEDYQDARIAEKEIREIRNGESKVLSLTDAKKLYDELVS
jgi:predicted DNA-binding protein